VVHGLAGLANAQQNCTQLPFVRSPMGKGVMPDDHPLSVAAARTLRCRSPTSSS
jgi:thiamine pyrophosphate-dependent acetolactate synthase large subunit-like protein